MELYVPWLQPPYFECLEIPCQRIHHQLSRLATPLHSLVPPNTSFLLQSHHQILLTTFIHWFYHFLFWNRNDMIYLSFPTLRSRLSLKVYFMTYLMNQRPPVGPTVLCMKNHLYAGLLVYDECSWRPVVCAQCFCSLQKSRNTSTGQLLLDQEHSKHNPYPSNFKKTSTSVMNDSNPTRLATHLQNTGQCAPGFKTSLQKLAVHSLYPLKSHLFLIFSSSCSSYALYILSIATNSFTIVLRFPILMSCSFASRK